MDMRATLRAFLGEVLAHAGLRRMALGFALVILAGLTDGFGLSLLVPLLESLNGNAAPSSGIAATFAQALATVGLPFNLPLISALFLGLACLRSALACGRDLIQMQAQLAVVGGLRTRLYGAISRAAWPFLLRQRVSDLQTGLLTEIDRVSQGTFFAIGLPARLVVMLAHLAVAFAVSPRLAALALAIGLALAVSMRGRILRSIGLGKTLGAAHRRLHGEITDFLGGIKVAKGHGGEGRHLAAFAATIAEINGKLLAFSRSTVTARFFQEAGGAAVVVALLAAGSGLFHLAVSELLVLVLIFYRLLPITQEMQQAVQQISHMLPSFAAVMETCRHCDEAAEAMPGDPSVRVVLRREIRVEDVHFAHAGASPTEILKGVDLVLPMGSLTVLSGTSGSGKSTLLDLLIGLLPPADGRVLIDGGTLEGMLVPAWRRSIAYVPQDNFLFHDTLRANLLWTRPDATEDELKTALDHAAADFVLGWPEGLDTVVGDRGHRLSGGERQRLALARALLRQPTLLILDEATAGLDEGTERLVFQALARLRGTLTMVVVTHHPDAVRGADQHLILAGGRLDMADALT